MEKRVRVFPPQGYIHESTPSFLPSFPACFSLWSEAPDVKRCLGHVVSFMEDLRGPHLKRHGAPPPREA